MLKGSPDAMTLHYLVSNSISHVPLSSAGILTVDISPVCLAHGS